MPDLPDYYTQIQTLAVRADSLTGGADVSKPASPEAKDVYLATDTEKLWYCVADGAWAGYFMASTLLSANSLLYAVTADTPAALSVAASRIVGRKATGNLTTLAKADVLTIINVTEGADVTGDNAPQAHKASHQDGGSDEISIAALSGEPAELITHKDLTTGVHGVGAGAIVGTTLTQTLTNKTLTNPSIAAIDAGADNLAITTTGRSKGLSVTSSHPGGVGAGLWLQHNSASPEDGDEVAGIWFRGKSSTATYRSTALIIVSVTDVTHATYTGLMEFKLWNNGSENIAASLSGAGALTLAAGLEVGGTLNMADNILDELPATVSDVVGERAVGGIYRNTSGRPRLVMCGFAWLGAGDIGDIQARVGATSPPTTNVGRESGDETGGGKYAALTFLVPDNYYYEVDYVIGDSPSLDSWIEIDLFA